MTLHDAIRKHFSDDGPTTPEPPAEFKPDPVLDQMLARFDEMRAQPGGELIRFGSADRLEAYRRRRDLHINPDPKDAA